MIVTVQVVSMDCVEAGTGRIEAYPAGRYNGADTLADVSQTNVFGSLFSSGDLLVDVLSCWSSSNRIGLHTVLIKGCAEALS